MQKYDVYNETTGELLFTTNSKGLYIILDIPADKVELIVWEVENRGFSQLHKESGSFSLPVKIIKVYDDIALIKRFIEKRMTQELTGKEYGWEMIHGAFEEVKGFIETVVEK